MKTTKIFFTLPLWRTLELSHLQKNMGEWFSLTTIWSHVGRSLLKRHIHLWVHLHHHDWFYPSLADPSWRGTFTYGFICITMIGFIPRWQIPLEEAHSPMGSSAFFFIFCIPAHIQLWIDPYPVKLDVGTPPNGKVGGWYDAVILRLWKLETSYRKRTLDCSPNSVIEEGWICLINKRINTRDVR